MIDTIKALLKKGDPVTIAIDGNSAAGKSTLAKKLAALFDANLFHMDDYFLPIAQKTPERMAVPGNNVDWERFLDEVLLPLQTEKPFCYRPFDCGRQALADKVSVTPKKLTIVEGVYSQHPALKPYYALTVFMAMEKEEQASRILKRNGQAMLRRYTDEWIPLENRYFAHFQVKKNSDMVL